MTVYEMKEKLLAIMPGRLLLPDDNVVFDAIGRAQRRIAKETLPLRLRTSKTTSSILRKIGDETYVRLPLRPTTDEDDIDLDEALLDACAYHVCSEIEIQRKGHYLGFYEREIMLNNERLMETELDSCNNDYGSRPWV